MDSGARIALSLAVLLGAAILVFAETRRQRVLVAALLLIVTVAMMLLA